MSRIDLRLVGNVSMIKSHFLYSTILMGTKLMVLKQVYNQLSIIPTYVFFISVEIYFYEQQYNVWHISIPKHVSSKSDIPH